MLSKALYLIYKYYMNNLLFLNNNYDSILLNDIALTINLNKINEKF
jgi:hypothetical protein